MKKFAISFIFLGMALLTGCYNPNEYWHEHPDLYTEAIYSILGVRSHFDDNIHILESDEYGRTLYIYQPRDFIFAANDVTVLLISQASDKNYVYYYSGTNFILTEAYYSSEIGAIPFSEEEITQLKQANDWEESLKTDLLQKKQITRIKNDNTIDEVEALNIIDNDGLIQFSGDTQWACFFDKDLNRKHIFFIQDLNWNSESQEFEYLKSFVFLIYEDGTYEGGDSIMEISDVFSYQTDLSDFLSLNAWQQESNH